MFPISNEWIRRTTQLSPTIDIVIVNWNAGGQLRDCLESIVSADRYDVILERVVVVDNASHDGSADGLNDIGLPLELIRNPTNRGFAAACNQGTWGSNSDYILFLNPDTRLFGPSLTRPLRFMEQPENQHVGICGVQLVDERGVVVRSCSRFPTPRILLARLLGLSHLFPAWFRSHEMREWDHSESRKVDHVMGAFYLIRRPVFESLGGFDEDYFLYLEDLDLSLRALRVGWSSYYLADVQAFHRVGGTSDQVKAVRLFFSMRSRILYVFKHFSVSAALGLTLGTLIIEPIVRLASLAGRGSVRACWIRSRVMQCSGGLLPGWSLAGMEIRNEIPLEPVRSSRTSSRYCCRNPLMSLSHPPKRLFSGLGNLQLDHLAYSKSIAMNGIRPGLYLGRAGGLQGGVCLPILRSLGIRGLAGRGSKEDVMKVIMLHFLHWRLRAEEIAGVVQVGLRRFLGEKPAQARQVV